MDNGHEPLWLGTLTKYSPIERCSCNVESHLVEVDCQDHSLGERNCYL